MAAVKEFSSLDKYKDLPSNRFDKPAENPEPIKPVTSGTVKKKSFGQKMANTFLSEEANNVGQYCLWEIIIPSVKNVVSELITKSVDMVLFGEVRSSSKRSDGRGRSFTSYNSIYDSKDRGSRTVRRNRHTVEDIEIHADPDSGKTARQVANDVLDDMIELIERFGRCTVADYYDLVAIDWTPQDKNFGWKDLRGVGMIRTRDGVILDLPNIDQLN